MNSMIAHTKPSLQPNIKPGGLSFNTHPVYSSVTFTEDTLILFIYNLELSKGWSRVRPHPGAK